VGVGIHLMRDAGDLLDIHLKGDVVDHHEEDHRVGVGLENWVALGVQSTLGIGCDHNQDGVDLRDKEGILDLGVQDKALPAHNREDQDVQDVLVVHLEDLQAKRDLDVHQEILVQQEAH